MASSVRKFVERCTTCKECKPANNSKHPEMGKQRLSSKPFQILDIDFLQSLPRSRAGNSHLLVLLDVFSKWTMLVPVKKIGTELVIRMLEEQWFRHYSVPEILISDNASTFLSKEFKAFLDRYKRRMGSKLDKKDTASKQPGRMRPVKDGNQDTASKQPGRIQPATGCDQDTASKQPGRIQPATGGDQDTASKQPGRIQPATGGNQDTASKQPGRMQSATSGNQDTASKQLGRIQSATGGKQPGRMQSVTGGNQDTASKQPGRIQSATGGNQEIVSKQPGRMRSATGGSQNTGCKQPARGCSRDASKQRAMDGARDATNQLPKRMRLGSDSQSDLGVLDDTQRRMGSKLDKKDTASKQPGRMRPVKDGNQDTASKQPGRIQPATGCDQDTASKQPGRIQPATGGDQDTASKQPGRIQPATGGNQDTASKQPGRMQSATSGNQDTASKQLGRIQSATGGKQPGRMQSVTGGNQDTASKQPGRIQSATGGNQEIVSKQPGRMRSATGGSQNTGCKQPARGCSRDASKQRAMDGARDATNQLPKRMCLGSDSQSDLGVLDDTQRRMGSKLDKKDTASKQPGRMRPVKDGNQDTASKQPGRIQPATGCDQDTASKQPGRIQPATGGDQDTASKQPGRIQPATGGNQDTASKQPGRMQSATSGNQDTASKQLGRIQSATGGKQPGRMQSVTGGNQDTASKQPGRIQSATGGNQEIVSKQPGRMRSATGGSQNTGCKQPARGCSRDASKQRAMDGARDATNQLPKRMCLGSDSQSDLGVLDDTQEAEVFTALNPFAKGGLARSPPTGADSGVKVAANNGTNGEMEVVGDDTTSTLGGPLPAMQEVAKQLDSIIEFTSGRSNISKDLKQNLLADRGIQTEAFSFHGGATMAQEAIDFALSATKRLMEGETAKRPRPNVGTRSNAKRRATNKAKRRLGGADPGAKDPAGRRPEKATSQPKKAKAANRARTAERPGTSLPAPSVQDGEWQVNIFAEHWLFYEKWSYEDVSGRRRMNQ
ncbi:uncharacterized protein LOC131696254 [Topomyia yanbarensis]|uniref:uncharacterized protein LOC131696254 n=1 Tax=Topomyia yanbarensis TaxID=2498891 RepID=UPI00273C047D|nr:uncharacterized protein LOC131696254 [Topomyia yanbarensis]